MAHHLVHIGLYKTGTSWLQKIAAYAEKDLPFTYAHEHFADWVKFSQKKYDGDQDARFAALKQLFEDTKDEDTFISCEGLVAEDHGRLAAAIFEVLPDAHILITTRSPQEYIKSSFNSNTKRGQYISSEEFAKKRSKGQLMQIFDFDGLRAELLKHTSEDHIHFLPYESLREDAKGFLKTVSDLLGHDMTPYLIETARNASPPPKVLAFIREINRRVQEEAPEFAQSKEMNTFRNIAIQAIAYAEEMHPNFENLVQNFDYDMSMPELQPKTLRKIVEMTQCLKEIPAYEKYLDQYNFNMKFKEKEQAA